eukprot:m.112862 g.112862  ORF g.112862 m.112862 type:complete len:419 (-) comp28223_c0_seq2:258-1514(-)
MALAKRQSSCPKSLSTSLKQRPSTGFGSQSHRFDTRGIGHPTTKKPGTCISETYRIEAGFNVPIPKWPQGPKSYLSSNKAIHPFARNRSFGETKTYGSAEKKLKLYKTKESANRGPGFYDVTSRVPYEDQKYSIHIDHPGTRFPNEVPGSSVPTLIRDRYTAPAVGSYGADGIAETSQNYVGGKLSPTKLGIMDVQERGNEKESGSTLAPDHYHTQEPLLRENTGKVGPYNIDSGPRLVTLPKPVRLKMEHERHLAPGSYPVHPTPVKAEYMDFTKTSDRFGPQRPDNREFYNNIEWSKTIPQAAPFGANAYRMSDTTSHDVGSNQYTKTKTWTDRKQSQGKYSQTYKSSVDAKVPRFDDRTPDIGLMTERQRSRNNRGKRHAPELSITGGDRGAAASLLTSRLARVPPRRFSVVGAH